MRKYFLVCGGEGYGQARSQLETQGGAKRFWEGPKFFKLCLTHFIPASPLVTGLFMYGCTAKFDRR